MKTHVPPYYGQYVKDAKDLKGTVIKTGEYTEGPDYSIIRNSIALLLGVLFALIVSRFIRFI